MGGPTIATNQSGSVEQKIPNHLLYAQPAQNAQHVQHAQPAQYEQLAQLVQPATEQPAAAAAVANEAESEESEPLILVIVKDILDQLIALYSQYGFTRPLTPEEFKFLTCKLAGISIWSEKKFLEIGETITITQQELDEFIIYYTNIFELLSEPSVRFLWENNLIEEFGTSRQKMQQMILDAYSQRSNNYIKAFVIGISRRYSGLSIMYSIKYVDQPVIEFHIILIKYGEVYSEDDDNGDGNSDSRQRNLGLPRKYFSIDSENATGNNDDNDGLVEEQEDPSIVDEVEIEQLDKALSLKRLLMGFSHMKVFAKNLGLKREVFSA
jgi:hypothetical protein